MQMFDGLEVFSATMFRDRAMLGERVTDWIAANPQYDIVDYDVVQSSDEAFHCTTIVIYFKLSAYADAKKSIAAATGKPRVAAAGAK